MHPTSAHLFADRPASRPFGNHNIERTIAKVVVIIIMIAMITIIIIVIIIANGRCSGRRSHIRLRLVASLPTSDLLVSSLAMESRCMYLESSFGHPI